MESQGGRRNEKHRVLPLVYIIYVLQFLIVNKTTLHNYLLVL